MAQKTRLVTATTNHLGWNFRQTKDDLTKGRKTWVQPVFCPDRSWRGAKLQSGMLISPRKGSDDNQGHPRLVLLGKTRAPQTGCQQTGPPISPLDLAQARQPRIGTHIRTVKARQDRPPSHE